MRDSKSHLAQLLNILSKETRFVDFKELQTELSLSANEIEDLVIELEDKTRGILKFKFAEEGAVVLLSSNDKVKEYLDSGSLS